MLAQLRDFVEANQWTDLKLLPFFSMVDRRKSLHHEVIETTRAQFPELLASEVPYSSEIERMSLRRAPIAAYAPRSAAAQIYDALWKEIQARMQGPVRRPEPASLPQSVIPPQSAGLPQSTGGNPAGE
jgi:cellulose biosynthesis protein BcsQ